MSSSFTLDGVQYNVFVPRGGIKRSGQIVDGQAAGRSQVSAIMIRDIKGTFYNYTIQIDSRYTDPDEYDKLYEQLTAPVPSHTLVVPYGQDTLEYEAYVTSAEDTLQSMDNSVNVWGGLSINFIAMKPKRTP